MNRLARTLAGLALIGPLVAVTGCAGVAPIVNRPASYAVPLSTETQLGRVATNSLPFSQASGFALLPTGSGALDARLELIARSETALDLQYFEFAHDTSGAAIARSLCEAALRGVRVRLVVDDSQTLGSDPLFLAMAHRENIEVRVFNPFFRGRSRSLSRLVALLGEFSRLDSRMHNKLLVADGAFAISGGRNIADAYFGKHSTEAFVDLDVLITGAVVPELAATFDAYWNSSRAFPIEQIADDINKVDAEKALSVWLASASHILRIPTRSIDPLGRRPLGVDLDEGRLDLRWGTARAFSDSPNKENVAGSLLGHRASATARQLRDIVWEEMAAATAEYTIVTPYLVPSEGGMDQVRRNRARGVKISILTNSLAATDVPLVHGGYQRYRKDLLHQGVELHELGVHFGAALVGDAVPPRTSVHLHMKCVVFDRDTVFIGSLNFDPRSTFLNTEVGFIVRSADLAQDVLDLIDIAMHTASYAVGLDADGHLLWTPPSAAPSTRVLRVEPDASAIRRLFERVTAPLVPENLL